MRIVARVFAIFSIFAVLVAIPAFFAIFGSGQGQAIGIAQLALQAFLALSYVGALGARRVYRAFFQDWFRRREEAEIHRAAEELEASIESKREVTVPTQGGYRTAPVTIPKQPREQQSRWWPRLQVGALLFGLFSVLAAISWFVFASSVAPAILSLALGLLTAVFAIGFAQPSKEDVAKARVRVEEEARAYEAELEKKIRVSDLPRADEAAERVPMEAAAEVAKEAPAEVAKETAEEAAAEVAKEAAEKVAQQAEEEEERESPRDRAL